MARDMETVLANGKIHLAQDFVSDNESMRQYELMDQLDYYARLVVPSTDPDRFPDKVFYSGKGQGKKDDLAMALMIGLTHSKVTKSERSFVDMCQLQGWRY